jgi:SPOR domain
VAEFNQNQEPNPNPQPAQDPVPQLEPEHESHLIDEIPRKNKFLTAVKNLLALVILVVVILGSFWISFNLGKTLLLPAKRSATEKIDVSIPEPPASIAHLQKLDELMGQTKEAKAQTGTLTVVEQTTTTTRARQAAKSVVGYTSASGRYYKVQAGYFKELSNALNLSKQLKANGFETFVRKINDGYRVQAGAFHSKKWAQQLQRSLKAKGFDSVLVFE